jgi:hypothetical protein
MDSGAKWMGKLPQPGIDIHIPGMIFLKELHQE